MDETTQLSQAASDDQGQVHFMDLDLDQTYVIAELSAPQGYDKTEELYEVTVDADGVSSALKEQRSGQEMHAVVNQKHPAPPAPDPSESENSTPPLRLQFCRIPGIGSLCWRWLAVSF